MIQYKKHDFSFLKINYNIKQVTSVMKLKKNPQKTRMSSDTSVLALFTENDVVDLASIYKTVPGSKDGTYIPQVHVFALVCANSVKYQTTCFSHVTLLYFTKFFFS